MKFIVETEAEEEKVNKLIRIPKSLNQQIEEIADYYNISTSKLIIQALKYAIDNIEEK